MGAFQPVIMDPLITRSCSQQTSSCFPLTYPPRSSACCILFSIMSTTVTVTEAAAQPQTPPQPGVVEKLTLWQKLTEVHINPLNGKCITLPILSLSSHYSRNFHLYVLLHTHTHDIAASCAKSSTTMTDHGSVFGWHCESTEFLIL